MSMPRDFDKTVLPPMKTKGTFTTGWKYPTAVSVITDGGGATWTDLGNDDLDNNTQVVFGGDNVRENVAYTTNSLLVKVFNGAPVPPNHVVDSISVGFYALMDSDGTRDYALRTTQIAIGASYPIVYPTTDIGITSVYPIFRDGIYANGSWRYKYDIPIADFGIGNLTSSMINSPEFYMCFKFSKTAGSSTTTSRIRLYHVIISITSHEPPPSASTDFANLLKFSTF